MSDRRFLLRWIAISAAATFVGLGLGGFIGLMGLHSGSVAAFVPSSVVFGAVIGGSVGLAEWTLLAERIPGLDMNRWIGRTGLGALVAWVVIALPVRNLTEVDAVRPSWVSLTLTAAGVGLVAGIIVASAQWSELRRHLNRAGWSIPLLGFGWAAGAVALFSISAVMNDSGSELVSVVMAAGVLLLSGALVASIQAVGLTRLLRSESKDIRVLTPTQR